MNIILHMPHTSLKVPKSFYKGLLISKQEFRKYNLEMTDLGIDELFKDYKYQKIKPKYSRLFCDVERFRNDKDEIMAKYGQGVVYTHLYNSVLFHKHNEKYKNKVLKYYDKYHKKLDKATIKLLKKNSSLLILDCHSFSDKMASHYFETPFPDICIGIEKNFHNQEILNFIIEKVKEKGYSYQINYPYKGSLIPNCIINQRIKGNVVSIMLEINKRIYL